MRFQTSTSVCVSCVVSLKTEQRLHSLCPLIIHLHSRGVINHTVQAVGLRPFLSQCRSSQAAGGHTHSAAGTIPHIWILDCRYYPVKVCMGHKDNKSEGETHWTSCYRSAQSQSLSRRWVLTGKVWMGEMAITQIDSHRIVVIHEGSPAAAAAHTHTNTHTHTLLWIWGKTSKTIEKKYTHTSSVVMFCWVVAIIVNPQQALPRL